MKKAGMTTRERKKQNKTNLPASKDWSISRKRFVLFSAMTLSAPLEEKKRDWSLFHSLFFSLLLFLCQVEPVFLFFWWVFLSFCLPSFLFSHFLPLFRPLLAHFLCQRVCLPQRGDSAQRHTGLLAASSGSRLVYGSGKLHCHISCFSAWN